MAFIALMSVALTGLYMTAGKWSGPLLKYVLTERYGTDISIGDIVVQQNAVTLKDIRLSGIASGTVDRVDIAYRFEDIPTLHVPGVTVYAAKLTLDCSGSNAAALLCSKAEETGFPDPLSLPIHGIMDRLTLQKGDITFITDGQNFHASNVGLSFEKGLALLGGDVGGTRIGLELSGTDGPKSLGFSLKGPLKPLAALSSSEKDISGELDLNGKVGFADGLYEHLVSGHISPSELFTVKGKVVATSDRIGFGGVDISGRYEVLFENGGIRLVPSKDAQVELNVLHIGFGDEIAEDLQARQGKILLSRNVTVSDDHGTKLNLSLAPVSLSFDGLWPQHIETEGLSVDFTKDMGSGDGFSGALKGPLKLSRGDDGYKATFSKGTVLSLTDLTLDANSYVKDAISAKLENDISITPAPDSPLPLVTPVRLGIPDTTILAPGKGSGRNSFKIRPVEIDFESTSDRMKLKLRTAGFSIPEAGLSVKSYSTDIDYDPIRDHGTLASSIEDAKLDGKSLSASPLDFSSRLDGLLSGNASMEGSLRSRDGSIEIRYRGTMGQPEAPAPMVTFESNAVELASTDGKPAPSPLLTATGLISRGTVSLAGNASYGNYGFDGTATLHLKGIEGQSAGVPFTLADTDIAFNMAELPSTLPDQKIELMVEHPLFGRIDLAGSLSLLPNGLIRFEPGTLTSDALVVDLTQARYDRNSGRGDLSFSSQALDLFALTRRLGVDGMTGQGLFTMKGNAGLARNGRFTMDAEILSAGSGLLAVTDPELTKLLSNRNEAVDLLVEALKDFHYDSLSMHITVPDSGPGNIALHLKGANPDVLSGQPFNLNINIESDYNKILKQITTSLEPIMPLLGKLYGGSGNR